MNGKMANSALNVKIHAKLKNRITREMYIKMTNLSSVSSLARFLKSETSWGDALSDIDEEKIHRSHLESLLSHSVNREIKALSYFADISSSAFLKLFSIREEIENLKVFLRLLCANQTEKFTIPPKISKKDGIDFGAFMKIRSFSELLAELSGTIYEMPLRPFSEASEELNIFDIEMALDLYYTELVFKLAKKRLSAAEYKSVCETFGTEADLMTIMLILRIKKNFDLPSEQIYPYTRKKSAHLKDETIKRMTEAQSEDEVYEILKETRYAPIFKDKPKAPERIIEKYIESLHRKRFKAEGYSIEAVLYYVKIREVELRNIVTVIEGIRYSLPPERIQSYLIGF